MANAEALVAVGKRNLLLTVDGQEYRVLDALRYSVLPHVSLSLRQVVTSG